MSSFASGETANCTLHPPAKFPIARIIIMAMSRIFWKVVSLKVMAGATVILSPVWIPIGSKFSMLQMITTLSFASRSNSSSYSFQPINALSIMTSWIGERWSPRVSKRSKSDWLCTRLAPDPPSVYEGRIHNGKPNSWAISFPSKNDLAVNCGAIGTPISIIKSRNASRFSVISMALVSTPTMRTPYCSQRPLSSHWMARFNAVCPPIVGRTTSILCFWRMVSMLAVSNGSR